MKLSELKEKFGLTDKDIDGLEISPEQVVVHREFNRRRGSFGQERGPDYRERAVEHLLDQKASFRSEGNIFSEVARKTIALRCPVCSELVDSRFTSGAGKHYSYGGMCIPCKVEVSLSLEWDAIGVVFK